jgi:hypothetical protein
MHTDHFAVPNLAALHARGSGRPLLRLGALLAMVVFCVAVDALVVVLAWKAVVALVTHASPQTLVQLGLGAVVLTGVGAHWLRVRRAGRAASGGTARRIPPAGRARPGRDAGT